MFTLPPSWQSLPFAALQSLLATIQAFGASTRAAVEADPDNSDAIAQLEALAAAKGEVAAELALRNDTAEATAARAAAASAAFDDDEPAPAVVVPDVVPAAAEVETEIVVEADTEAAAAAAGDDDDDEDEEEEGEGEAAVAAEPFAAQPVAAAAARRMSSRRPASQVPVPSTGQTGGLVPMQIAPGVSGFAPGETNLDEACRAIAATAHTLSHTNAQRVPVPVVHWDWGFPQDQLLSEGSSVHNFSVLTRAQEAYRDEQEVLVAAGGPCAPLQSTYDFFSVFSPQAPLEQFLPTVGAPRGGIKFLTPVGLSAAALDGVDTRDAVDLALLPDDVGYTEKTFTRVTCPAEESVTVAAVYWSVRFDNLGFRVFPEQVRDFLAQVAVYHTRAKEIMYLDRIVAEAEAVVLPPAPAAGAARSLYSELVTAAHRYRKAHNMGRDAILDCLLPDAAMEILKIDMTMDDSIGGSFLLAPDTEVLRIVAQKARLNLGFYYYDSTAGGFPASAHNGSSAAWRALPTLIRSIMWSPGSVVRLDAGTLDVGPVRDSSLNRSNDLELFAEQFVEIAKVGTEIVQVDHTVNAVGSPGA